MALPNLITDAYASAYLAQFALKPAQLAFQANAVAVASTAVRRYCMDRDFTQTTYTTECLVELDGSIRLPQVPVNWIARVQTNPQQAMSVVNDTATTAWIYAATTGDLESGQTITGLVLNWESSGVTSSQTVTFASNETISSLASAIGAVGNGWSASADPVLGLWPVTELINLDASRGASPNDVPWGYAQFNVYSSNCTQVYFHPDDGQKTGIVFVGRQYGDLGPQWGPTWGETAGVQPVKGKVQVTYNAGFATIPTPVQLATAELTKAILARMVLDPYLLSEDAADYSYQIAVQLIRALPIEVQGGLSAYRITNA